MNAKPRISIIMRSHNDGDIIGRTLQAVRHQHEQDFELLNLDNSSTDDTLDEIRKINTYPERIINIPAGHYVPGAVLNEGVRQSRGEIIVLLNSDAPPLDEDWLGNLIEPLEDLQVGAVFGRQSPRQDARAIVRRDHDCAFPKEGDRSRSWLGNPSWTEFFSMANSATRRDVIASHPFPEDVQYSEDIVWAKSLRDAGMRTIYQPTAETEHSHNYSFRQSWKRFYNEGMVDRRLSDSRGWRDSLLFFAVLPFVIQVAKDTNYLVCNHAFDVGEWSYSVRTRFAQKFARYQGFRQATGV